VRRDVQQSSGPVTAPARTPLSRDRVATAALDLIDREGLDALSMRKLGAALGVEAMSLYNHVDNKDDLLDAVSEVLHQQILARYDAPASSTWQDRARSMAFAYWHLAQAHPNAFAIVGSRPVSSPAGIATLGEAVQLFNDAGFDERRGSLMFHAAAAWLVGAINQELTLMRELRMGKGFVAADVPPELAFLPGFKQTCLAIDPAERFAAGLDVILRGVEAALND
jgi:AcrR family transcriptional regulator